jgi:hypothetical protein
MENSGEKKASFSESFFYFEIASMVQTSLAALVDEICDFVVV